MISEHWVDGLRVISVIGLSYGAWRGWRNRPPSFLHEGRKYFRLPDGRFCSRWGRIVTDPAKVAALSAATRS